MKITTIETTQNPQTLEPELSVHLILPHALMQSLDQPIHDISYDFCAEFGINFFNQLMAINAKPT